MALGEAVILGVGRGVDGLEASVGIVTLDGGIDEGVVAPRVIEAAGLVAERLS